MPALEDELDSLAAETGFSGVVRVDAADGAVTATAYGLAHRALCIPNTLETQLGIASGTKGLTALTVLSLVDEGVLELSTPVRSILGSDLPLVDDRVTVEQLLSHRSGIGDYLDEELDVDLSAYLMPVPVHELATTEDYLRILDGQPMKFAPGKRFAYCNSGFVVLALVAERVSGIPFSELVGERVCRPAGMRDTAFLRSDDLPAGAALGYLELDGAWRSNVFHLPVRGSGDGGIYTTAGDVRSLWRALFAGEIVSSETVGDALRARSVLPESGLRYGLGFWLHASSDVVSLIGADAGVWFRAVYSPESGAGHTVISNSGAGAQRLSRHLDGRLGL